MLLPSFKDCSCQCRKCKKHRLGPWVGEINLEMQPAPVFLPGKSHGQRSLTGSCQTGVWQSMGLQRVRHDWATERTHTHTLPSLAEVSSGSGLDRGLRPKRVWNLILKLVSCMIQDKLFPFSVPQFLHL